MVLGEEESVLLRTRCPYVLIEGFHCIIIIRVISLYSTVLSMYMYITWLANHSLPYM